MQLRIQHFLAGLIISAFITTPTMALDVDSYRAIANATVKQMDMGVVGDIDAMIRLQEELMLLGIEGGVEFLQTKPENGKALRLVVLNAESMKKMTLDEIEEQWHMGKFLSKRGIDQDKIEHFGPLMGLMDAVIHPATSYLALQEYKRTGNPDLLMRAKAELIEVLEHINHIKPSGDHMMATQ